MMHFYKSLLHFTFYLLLSSLFFSSVCVCACLKAKQGYKNLTGIDYSPASVELSRSVLQAEDLTDVVLKVS